ncbi:MAG: AAA family ATPase [Sphingomonas sp.]
MYLNHAVVENSGPLKWLSINLNFSDAGLPNPLILVGGNGSGKTNFMSLVVDALFEAAAIHHNNVLPTGGAGRSWFRIVGGRTQRMGAAGSFSVLRFNDAGTDRFYKEKSGTIDPAVANIRVPAEVMGQLNWPTEGSFKEFSLTDDRSRELFETGVYVYFPSSRSEVPYWLNREVFGETEFEVAPLFSKRLTKPILVERALDQFKQWLISVLADARTEIRPVIQDGQPQWGFSGNPAAALQSSPVLEICNQLLQLIFNDTNLRFAWLGRKSSDKVAIVRGNELVFPNLDALSTGQALLLGMFGSIIRYGDISQTGSGLDLSSIEGICLIDEIDAHIHIDLQHNILPKIVKMFPKIQFILTSHSPIFVLGMEKEFGVEGIQVVDMPNGIPVGAETYAEFGTALEALAASHAFTERVLAEARSGDKPIVYVEGETDAPYLKRAAVLLGKAAILEACDIEWIGAKDEKGQGYHTGKDALKHTLSVLKSNPTLATRKVLLLHDNDSNSQDQDYEGVSVRKIHVSEKNAKVTAGIENLLNESALDEQFYQEITEQKPRGDTITRKVIRKAELCAHLCSNGTAEQFSEFMEVLKIIEDYIQTKTK